ncbi:hypothetical protein KJ359_006147 [Pestalotiopsis sp. 9143b]|nr:hypothetical protein KJ359_006147 [Pestalotiopsis sp. 9143b]
MDISEDWDGTPQWDQEPKVLEKYIHHVDANVESRLPNGARSLEVIPHGHSYWTRTARIVAAEEDGARVSYFLKVSIGDDGRGMMRGEFASMRALHETAPDMAPKPITWGTYRTTEDVHFFLCAFHAMDAELCSLDTFPEMLAGLHRRGAARSNGKFGFPVTTYQGRLAQDMTWCDTWEESFSRNLDLYFEHELEAQGPDEELIELAPWRPARQKMGAPYVEAYLKHFPASEPAEDFDGRNALYAL